MDKLFVPEPCHENWTDMTAEDKGRFCQSCAKTVVDFTKSTKTEVIDYLKEAEGKTCGRFLSEHLDDSDCSDAPKSETSLPPVAKETITTPSFRFGYHLNSWGMAALAFAGFTFVGNKANAQKMGKVMLMGEPAIQQTSDVNKEQVEVKGTVTDTDNLPIGSANVSIESNGQLIGSVFSDAEGNYSVVLPPETIVHKTITVSAYARGQETKILEDLPVKKETITINLKLAAEEYFLMGDVAMEPEHFEEMGQGIVVGDPSEESTLTKGNAIVCTTVVEPVNSEVESITTMGDSILTTPWVVDENPLLPPQEITMGIPAHFELSEIDLNVEYTLPLELVIVNEEEAPEEQEVEKELTIEAIDVPSVVLGSVAYFPTEEEEEVLVLENDLIVAVDGVNVVEIPTVENTEGNSEEEEDTTTKIDDGLLTHPVLIGTLFPNPARDYCTIEVNESGLYNVQVIGLDGKVIRKTTLNGTQKRINVSQLPSGVYKVLVTSTDGTAQKTLSMVVGR